MALSAAHATPRDALVQALSTDLAGGLSTETAAELRAVHGENRLPDAKPTSWLTRLIRQFASPLVLTLLGAAAIAVVVGLRARDVSTWSRFGDALAIAIIVVINAVLGLVQEGRAESALRALRSLEVPRARVLRDGKLSEVSSVELVPGDVVELEAGDAVPADVRLVTAIELAVDESTLTGESVPVAKDARATLAIDVPVAERTTMLFLGTTITRGRAKGVVASTASSTELGRIGRMLAEPATQQSPLERRLARFGRNVLWACLAVSAALFAIGVIRGERGWASLLLEAVSFAVAAIPEGLPAITTITLALGMQRMARRGAIVRKLPAVEALGTATVICTDKTGTLTQNAMTVRTIWTDSARYVVDGEGYAPSGAVRDSRGVECSPIPLGIIDLALSGALCSHATIVEDGPTLRVIGDPTEGALVTLAAKIGYPAAVLSRRFVAVREVPFDSDRRMMTVVTRSSRGEVAHVKGSTESVVARCTRIATAAGTRPMGAPDSQRILQQADSMAATGLRVLAVARNDAPGADAEQDLTFLGMVGVNDPPRPSARRAIERCRQAGIRVVMITGDHALTARAIADELGLSSQGDRVVSGPELAAMSDAELAAVAPEVTIFARTTAEQKLRIVRAYQARGEVVAMTGDGVNDAPALRTADIGVAMGRSGTDVAKQAADLVITDDDFATIVDAVQEGRGIYRNIRKFIYFLLSANAGLSVAVFTIALAPGWAQLTPLMILWINLVTNGLPALALGIDPAEESLMTTPPRAPQEGLLRPREVVRIAVVGTVMGGLAVCMYVTSLCAADVREAPRTLAFTALALAPLVHAFSCRAGDRTILEHRPRVSAALLAAVAVSASVQLIAVLIPPLRPFFRTEAIHAMGWWMVGVCTLLVLPVHELTKLLQRGRAAISSRRPVGLPS